MGVDRVRRGQAFFLSLRVIWAVVVLALITIIVLYRGVNELIGTKIIS